jgi:hypothetical protein
MRFHPALPVLVVSGCLCGRSPAVLMSGASEATFCRANDFLGTGAQCTARQVVNVLGRWSESREWDSGSIGRLLDEVLAGECNFDDYTQQRAGLALAGDVNGVPSTAAATPRRRAFCQRNNLVQRYIFAANVGALPFRSAALASSVGATLAELSAEPVDPLAIDVVFDALCESSSGIVDKNECDKRRAAFETDVGAFDALAFHGGLDTARKNLLAGYAIYPGSLNLVFLIAAIKLDVFTMAGEAREDVLGVVGDNWTALGPASLLMIIPPIAIIAYGATNPKGGKAAGDAAAADRIFVETRVAQRTLQRTQARTKAQTQVPTSTLSN